MVNAKITFSRFNDRISLSRSNHDGVVSRSVAHLNHADVVIGTAHRTGITADAGEIVYYDLTTFLVTMDRPSRASDHANWISTMHAGIGDHVMAHGFAMPNESWVVIVAGGASSDTFIAARATIQVYYHRRGSVHKTVLDDKLYKFWIDVFGLFTGRGGHRCRGFCEGNVSLSIS